MHNNQKLDKSLLPKPQQVIGWKNRQLKISTSTANRLLEQQASQQVATKKNTQSVNTSNPFSTKQLQSIITPQSNQHRESYQSNRQSINSHDKSMHQMTPSQYSLEQKQLLTFAANRSNESQGQLNYNRDVVQPPLIANTTSKRRSYFQQSVSEEQPNTNRSQSKSKEHKTTIYRHALPQKEEFIAYSVTTKESKSGMFSNQKLLLINSFTRQLMYFSKLPKLLPFSSFQQMQTQFLQNERPKQVIQLDKVRRFMFVPGKGSLASVVVSYVNDSGERKEWKFGMGNNAVMNQWIQLVNQVVKKEHYSQIKSQVKYPPKPKKQSQHKSNNYDTKFTKTLKQQVLPLIRQTRLTQTTNKNQSYSPTQSSVRSTKNESSNQKSKQKQYYIDQSKFLNTKNYVIDLEDVRNQDIFYQPEVKVKMKEEIPKAIVNERSQQPTSLVFNNSNHPKIPPKSLLLTQEEPSVNSRFSQELQKRQQQMYLQHKNRISTFYNQPQVKQQRKIPEIIQQPSMLSKKSSGERLSQKDLNIHIDSRTVFEELQQAQDRQKGQEQQDREIEYDDYQMEEQKDRRMDFSSPTDNRVSTNENRVNQKTIPSQPTSPSPSPISHQHLPTFPRRRGYTQLITEPQSSHRYSHHPKSNEQNTHITQPSTRNTTSPNQYKRQPQFAQPAYSQRDKRYPQSIADRSQIQDVIMGGRLQQGYILNFSPHSLTNNWFRLWLQTQPQNKPQIYTSFVKACQTITTKLIDSPQQFINSSTMTQNNTHIIFTLQNITFKLPFKLHLPQGLGEFISVMDFIKSQVFLSQVFNYEKQIQDEFGNYEFVLKQLSSEFNNGVLSLPVYMPMCCLVKYKGISVLCKASMESSNLKIHKIPLSQYKQYQSQLQYVEESCHVSFGLSQGEQPSFDLYQIYLSSFNKSIVYMDNQKRFLPLLINPLQKSASPSLQLGRCYVEQNITTGIVSQRKDVEEIEGHIMGHVVKKVAGQIQQDLKSSSSISQLIKEKGLTKQYFGVIYNMLEQPQGISHNLPKQPFIRQVLLTEIILNQYTKACKLYFMKQFIRQLSNSLSDYNQSPGKSHQSRFSSSTVSNTKTIKQLQLNAQSTSLSYGQSHSRAVTEMLHLLLYKNTKVWTVLATALSEKYGIDQFRKLGPGAVVNALAKKVCLPYLVLNFLGKLGVTGEVRSWSEATTWENFALSQQTLIISAHPQTNCYSLQLFNPQYQHLLAQISLTSSPSLSSKNIFHKVLEILNICEQSYNGNSRLIKSSQYELLEVGFQKQRQLIDLTLSWFLPVPANKDSLNINIQKDKMIELYKKLLIQSQTRNSKDISVIMFQTHINGLKWLIRQRQYHLVQILIEQQLQCIDIWLTTFLIPTKCKLLDLAALFYHHKLGNKNNKATEYSLKSLTLCLQNKPLFQLTQLAERSFQAANIHFQSYQIQKALQLYQLTQKIIYQSQRNKSLQQTDLSMQFLRIYLKKAQIKLTMGKTLQSLNYCLQCLRKCQQFEDLYLEDLQNSQNDQQTLEQIQLSVFQLIFRCYEVTQNIQEMLKIAKLCCSKFLEDKILILRMARNFKSKTLDDSINYKSMSRILRMAWVTLIAELSQRKVVNSDSVMEDKPFIPMPHVLKSFCLSGALSQRNKPSQSTNCSQLQEIKQKLIALSKLYSRNRYDDETLTTFVCQDIIENSPRISNQNNKQAEYQLIGENRKKQLMSSRIGELINTPTNESQCFSILYQRFSEVFKELADISKKSNTPKKSQKRLNPGISMTANRSSHSREARQRSIQRQSQPQTSAKKQSRKYYESYNGNQPSVSPFSSKFSGYQSQFQPELRMSINTQYTQFEQERQRIGAYDVYSLKDEMDRKYMLMQAVFGLCGRQFVIGYLDECIQKEREFIEKERLKQDKGRQFQNMSKASMFYD